MTKIVFLDRGTFAPEIDLLRPVIDHEWMEYAATPADQIVERLKGATIAITNKVPIRAETLERLPDLKMVSVAATGFDVIDVPACREHGVIVSNVRGYAGQHGAGAHIRADFRVAPGHRRVCTGRGG